jgi:hypothetical protein
MAGTKEVSKSLASDPIYTLHDDYEKDATASSEVGHIFRYINHRKTNVKDENGRVVAKKGGRKLFVAEHRVWDPKSKAHKLVGIYDSIHERNPQEIIFNEETGEIVVPKGKRELVRFLMFSPLNRDSPFKESGVRPMWEAVDRVAEAQSRVETDMELIKLKADVYSLDGFELRAIAHKLNVNTSSDKFTIKETMIKLIDSPKNKSKVQVAMSNRPRVRIEYAVNFGARPEVGVLSYDSITRTWSILPKDKRGSSSKLLTIEPDSKRDLQEELILYLTSKECKSQATKILDRVKEIIIG